MNAFWKWVARLPASFVRVAFCLVAQTLSFAAEMPPLSIGVAQMDITPAYSVRLSGFGGRRAESEGVTQRIWAKALVITDEKAGPAVLIAADNLCVPDEITKEVAQRLGRRIGLKLERLTITATHTHTAPMLKNVAPTLFGVPIPDAHQTNIDRYTREFTDALVNVALEAHRATRPSRLSWACGTVDFAVNRRTKGGPVDHDLPALVVRDLEDNVRAIYFSYACHCVTLSDNKISGDWAGYAQEHIQKLFPGAVAIASVGCGADSNPSSGVTGANLEVCSTQGKQIADEIQRLLKQPATPIAAPSEIKYARLDLPLAPPRTRADWEERSKRNDAVGYHAKVNLARLDRGETLAAHINYPIQTWVFGDQLAMVFLPGETVVDYSLRLKREFDRDRLWVNGYSNDGRAYIPSERVLKEGGYEGGDAMIYYDFPQAFAPGLEQKIIDVVSAQLPATFKAPAGTEGSRPLGAREALKTLRVPSGLEAQLVAAEPLIQSPVAIDWSADGKLWVCEMNDYPSGLDQNWQPGGRVKFLEDTDGDGRYDKATLFADHLPFPTGITAWGKGLFISAAPDIYWAEDTNGDGRADKLEKIFSGFFTDNFQARVNSLNIGLDNWIYAANGLLGGTIETLPNSLFAVAGQKVDIRNRDFRFHPVTGKMEVVSGLTQQGRARDDWGNWFGCDNSQLLLHFPAVEKYLRRNPHLNGSVAPRNLAGGPDGNRIYPASRLLERFNDPEHANRVTSACGLGIYRDTYLGESFFGNAFTCEPVHNLVHRRVVLAAEALTSQRAPENAESEFLASTDNWFRPVQARPGPDGALYIVDMYRFLIEHPRWIPAARLSQIDVRAGSDKGRIYRIVKQGAPLRAIHDLTKLNAPALAAALDSPNGHHRDRVHIELLTRRDTNALPELKRLATTASFPQVRLQALSIADGLSGSSVDQLLAALKDRDPHVRQHAIRLSEPFLTRGGSDADSFLQAFAAMTNDTSTRVLEQLAYSLGESIDRRAGQFLAQLTRASVPNASMRTAILSSSSAHAAAILDAVLASADDTPGRSEWISPLIATLLNSPDSDALNAAVRAILPENKPANIPAILTLLDSLERRQIDLDTALPVGSALRARFDEAVRNAADIAANAGASEASRELAISLLGRDANRRSLPLIAGLLHQSSNLRRAALNALKRHRDVRVAELLLAQWPKSSPSTRADIASALVVRADWTLALLHAAQDGTVAPNEISLADRQRIAASENADIRALAADVFPVLGISSREEVLAKYKSAAGGQGNAAQGAALFAQHCSTCHALNGVGSAVGPDLAPLRSKDAEYWLKNILDPNAVIEPRFVNYTVEMKDGRTLSGIIRSENANSLLLVSAANAEETIVRNSISSIEASRLSLMPEGLEEAVTVEQMADLIAYLQTGRARKQLAGNQPKSVAPLGDGSLMLKATDAEIYGAEITFEAQWRNIGLWHGQDDYVSWTVTVPHAGHYDVYLDYACAASSAGNRFTLTAGSRSIDGVVKGTGADWSNYKQLHVGQIALDAGSHTLTFRAGPNLKGALIDLRTIALAPVGKNPRWTATPAVTENDVLRDAGSVGRFILDPTRPEAARQTAVTANPQFAAALVTEMTRDLQPGTPEEYRRIPWIWQVAIACGKRNDANQIRAMLDASLPKEDQPLHDWQAVVIGGGIINGLSQRNIWPGERILEILGNDSDLKSRWQRALELASAMSDNKKVPTGTRYDSLRMIALDSWPKPKWQLLRYLEKGVHAELQMGAVSGLVDVNSPESTTALLTALAYLSGNNRELALQGLLRGEARVTALLKAVETGALPRAALGEGRIRELKEHPNEALRTRAQALFSEKK